MEAPFFSFIFYILVVVLCLVSQLLFRSQQLAHLVGMCAFYRLFFFLHVSHGDGYLLPPVESFPNIVGKTKKTPIKHGSAFSLSKLSSSQFPIEMSRHLHFRRVRLMSAHISYAHMFRSKLENFQPPYLAGRGSSGSFYFQSERRNRTTTTAAKETKKKKSNNKKRRKSDCWVIGNSVVLYQIKRSERNRETTTVGSDGIEIHGWIRFQGPSFDWRRSPIACLFFLCSCNPSKDKGERRIIIPHRWSDSTEREHSEWWTAL